ncbi:MAG: Integration host factor subunit alpha [Candidatus Scalindua rubra]|uniref:Integration host factor subunit alpha n=1 Tax=Candidatus Scalindua rubra TaxID=1872076 RepID=A0A1E3XA92_9BACT|nr:MAG: Integration host factor subunit alpha [Candidatus Scalindua rubra]
MSKSISKKEFIQKLALKMNTNEKTSASWVDGVTDTLYETFREGQGVSLTGLGSFYMERRGYSCVFKFNPSQKIKKLLGWSSTYKGEI